MRTLIYASRAVHDFGDEELLELLERARGVNLDLGVTGMLVYAARSFLQLIEGDEAAVAKVWERIRADDRHTALRVLRDESTLHRLFGDWSMGFEHPGEEDLEETLPGYRASTAYPFVSSELVDAAETAETLLSLYARRSA
ncbi:MAG: BLUF domain-containing protein [Mycobacteriales bacterium]